MNTDILAVEFTNVAKAFVTRQNAVVLALRNVNLTVRQGEFLTIIGPSGCGKSTILNILAGIQAPTSGAVNVAGRPLGEVRHDIGYVFQQDTVLPWRSVRDNIAMGLLIRRVPTGQRNRQIDELIELTGLKGFEAAYPTELSGGMRKRVALATALAFDPPMLLMDEPFGALDAQIRLSLQEELMRIWEVKKKTVLFVTHDLNEAIILADRIVVMTARPATIKSVWDVTLPRPRRADEVALGQDYQGLYAQLWRELRPEVAAQGKTGGTA